jgi:nucleotide-binding universal stress UspA family protein
MKKTIVVPTDFSHNALVAAKYALQFAQQQDYEVHLLHAYVPFTSAFQNPRTIEEDGSKIRKEAETDMREFLDKLGTNEALKIPTSITQGNLTDCLMQFVNEHSVGLIIMGTHGASGTRKDVLGSNTYDVAKSSRVPLIVVPEHITEFRLDKAVFFTDYQPTDKQTLKAFKDVVSGRPVPCTLVHIAPNAKEDPQQMRRLEEWNQQLQTETGYDLLHSELARDSEKLERVNITIDDLAADLSILTLVGGRGFLEKLFHKSLARQIVLNPKRPVFLLTAI